MKILYVANGGIGDSILNFPVITALRKANPGAVIHWGGRADVGLLARSVGVVDSEMPEMGVRYDKTYWSGHGHPSAPHVRYPDKHVLVQGSNEGDYMPVQKLRLLGLPETLDWGMAGLWKPQRKVAFITGASILAKGWGGWEAASKAVPAGWTVVLPSGGSEALVTTLAAQRPGCEVIQWKRLLDVVEALGTCSAYLGLDTGLSHAMHAMGCPGVILWPFAGYDAYKAGPPAKILSRTDTAEKAMASLALT